MMYLKRTIYALGIFTALFLSVGCELFQSEDPGVIALTSDAAGASVYIDEQLKNDLTISGTLNFEVNPGSHSLLIYKSGLAPLYKNVEVKSGKTTEVSYTDAAATEELSRNFDDSMDVSYFDNRTGMSASVETDSSGNNYIRLINDIDYSYLYTPVLDIDYVDRMSGVVYEIKTLQLNGSRLTMYVKTNRANEPDEYYMVGGGHFAYEIYDGEPDWTKISDIPYITTDEEIEHVVVGFSDRLVYLRDGEMLLNWKEEGYEVLGNINGMALELTNEDHSNYDITADLDDIEVFSFDG